MPNHESKSILTGEYAFQNDDNSEDTCGNSMSSITKNDSSSSSSIMSSSRVPQAILSETEASSSSSSPSPSYAGSDCANDASVLMEDSMDAPPKQDDNCDPYSDVRDRMESLSLRSRMIHVYHTTDKHDLEDDEMIHSEGGEPVIPLFAAWTTYLGYAVLIFVGHIRDICATLFQKGRYLTHKNRKTYCASDDISTHAPLLKSWENFYTKRLYHRIQDCFNRPIASNPGATIQMLERISHDGNKTMQVLGQLDNIESMQDKNVYVNGTHFSTVSGNRVTRKCLNFGSYNYLGFADDWNITCRAGVFSSLVDLPVSNSSSRMELGTTKLHDQLENLVAEYIGKEEAMVLNMGFNTNATTIPALMGRGDLIISDELNHTSIVNGARTSGSAIRCFRHNDTKHLESILREAIVYGQPRTHRPWRKIMVIVEGIYSMEGEFCDLRNVVKVCKKYGAYVYLDEAHSIGMGSTGRGCCEYTGVDPADVDILMGTFTKAFGGMGGYIASSKEVIQALREHCAASAYHNALSPVVCQQIISSFKVIMGQDGTNIGKQKLSSLRDNSNYVRMRLTDMGLHVLGHYDSPIIPVMLYNPTKIAAFSRECLKRGLAVVVVGFPAVPILMSRARFCISAGHSRNELDKALKEIDEIADILKLRYAKSTFG